MELLSEKIYQYAKEVNMHCNAIFYYIGKDMEQVRMARSFFSTAISDFYNLVHQNKGMSLINCKTQYLYEIGLAYIKIALYHKASPQNWYVNSVSAENAFYCLSKSYEETGNVAPLPFLFMLLNENKNLLDDKFEQSWKELNPEIVRLPYSMGSLSTQVMLSACVRYYYVYVQHFILSKFYDLKNDMILVNDKIFEFYYPNYIDVIHSFIRNYSNYDKDEYATDRETLGETYFKMIYKCCEDALLNY